MFGFGRKPEERASFTQSAPVSFLEAIGLDVQMGGIEGIHVNTESALSVPAISDAVNFISGTLAGLPLHVYKKTEKGRERVEGGLSTILHSAVNDEMSSFEWRKYTYEQVLTGGRGLTYIERTSGRTVQNLWPLDPTCVTVKRRAGRKFYEYKDGGKTVEYEASEIIDLPFMLKADGITHRGPIAMNKDVVSLAIAATRYGAKFFENGGVPPFVVQGNFQSATALKNASEDFQRAVREASKEDRLALTLPNGLEVKQLGVDPEKSQLVETKRFLIEEIARIYAIPPTFLQDLTHGTFSNTEQQDLHFVKHTIKRWIEQFEQEANLKLFGRRSDKTYVEFDVDGLLRGDFKTRMDGYAQGIQNGVLTPNEARRAENRPDQDGGDKLYIQGATVPLDQAGQQQELPLNEPSEGNDNAA